MLLCTAIECNNTRAQEIYYILWQIQIQLQKLWQIKISKKECNSVQHCPQSPGNILHLITLLHAHLYYLSLGISQWEIYHFIFSQKITFLRSARKNNANPCNKCRWSFVESICFKLSLSAINIRCVIGNIGERQKIAPDQLIDNQTYFKCMEYIFQILPIFQFADKYMLSTVFNDMLCSISNILVCWWKVVVMMQKKDISMAMTEAWTLFLCL